jgi:hypothetical protein
VEQILCTCRPQNEALPLKNKKTILRRKLSGLISRKTNLDRCFQNFGFCNSSIFEILVFALCAARSARPRGRMGKCHSQKSLCDLCPTLARKVSQTCTYVPFTPQTSCCRCVVLLKSGDAMQTNFSSPPPLSTADDSTTGRSSGINSTYMTKAALYARVFTSKDPNCKPARYLEQRPGGEGGGGLGGLGGGGFGGGRSVTMPSSCFLARLGRQARRLLHPLDAYFNRFFTIAVQSCPGGGPAVGGENHGFPADKHRGPRSA